MGWIDPKSKEDSMTPESSNERRIVVGVDGSPCATRALEFAAHEAAHCGALCTSCVSSTSFPSPAV